jgi:hypothetical protein
MFYRYECSRMAFAYVFRDDVLSLMLMDAENHTRAVVSIRVRLSLYHQGYYPNIL